MPDFFQKIQLAFERSIYLRREAVALLLGFMCLLNGAAFAAAASVGEVSLSIGQSDIERSDGATVNVKKGDKINQGDVIKTSASGHVHIRFIDGALISVRPNSVFVIQQFDYNPLQPKESIVRLSLTRGEVRSISGRAAEEAKDKFRLNTPLVAIGVKGTDFVASSAQDATRVTVNSGAIVMAPFDGACRAEGLGVCVSARARELTADMTGMALIYKNGAPDPSLQKLVSSKDAGKLQEGERQIKDGPERSAVTTKEATSPEQLLPKARMVWGRWSQTPVVGDGLTVSFRDAIKGNEVTVGDGYYFLFREPGAINALSNLNHQVDFKLQDSSAYYQKADNTLQSAQIKDASFGIDFGQRTFATKLQVSTEGMPPQNMQFAGQVDVKTGIFLDKGITVGNQGNQSNLAGALTLNGLQAGYFFRYNLESGKLSGATLWGR